MREALLASVDFERLRDRSPIKLLIAVTRVSDGRLRILTNAELTVEAVLASACLPLLHHAIEIDGEAYWDGGYAANPPLIPLDPGLGMRSRARRPGHADQIGSAAEDRARYCQAHRADPVQRNAQ